MLANVVTMLQKLKKDIEPTMAEFPIRQTRKHELNIDL